MYRFVRYPQYIGFLALSYGFLVQWPTLPTLVLFPILAVIYYELARREEADLERLFGEEYTRYHARTPMLFPGLRKAARKPEFAGAGR